MANGNIGNPRITDPFVHCLFLPRFGVSKKSLKYGCILPVWSHTGGLLTFTCCQWPCKLLYTSMAAGVQALFHNTSITSIGYVKKWHDP